MRMATTTAKFKQDWSVERLEFTPSSLDEQFLVGHRRLTPLSLPFIKQ